MPAELQGRIDSSSAMMLLDVRSLPVFFSGGMACAVRVIIIVCCSQMMQDALSETGRVAGPPMTVDGAVTKTAIFLALAAASGSWTWMQVGKGRMCHATRVPRAADAMQLHSSHAIPMP